MLSQQPCTLFGAPPYACLAESGEGRSKERKRERGLETLLIDILPVALGAAAFVCLDNGSYLRRGLCSGLLSPRIKGSQACSPLVQRHRGGTANLIEEAALGRPFRDAPLSPNAVISPSLCWGGIKITKKVILSIFFLIIIVRLGDKGPT